MPINMYPIIYASENTTHLGEKGEMYSNFFWKICTIRMQEVDCTADSTMIHPIFLVYPPGDMTQAQPAVWELRGFWRVPYGFMWQYIMNRRTKFVY